MGDILVDQSHCNYHLARLLEHNRWAILFTDGGRVSRGGVGLQGASLRVFEQHGLPIPDITAVLDGELLFVEIDSYYSRAKESIERYLLSRQLLLETMREMCPSIPVDRLSVGFCRTALIKKRDNYLRRMLVLEPRVRLWVVFVAPRQPNLCWAPSHTA